MWHYMWTYQDDELCIGVETASEADALFLAPAQVDALKYKLTSHSTQCISNSQE